MLQQDVRGASMFLPARIFAFWCFEPEPQWCRGLHYLGIIPSRTAAVSAASIPYTKMHCVTY